MGRPGKGVARQRLTQTFGDLEVWGASAEAEADMSGSLTGQVFGSVAVGLDEDIPDTGACKRRPKDMVKLAIKQENMDPSDSRVGDRDVKRLIFMDPETHHGSLAYRVDFSYHTEEMPSAPVYFIDACDDKVLLTYNKIKNMTMSHMKRDIPVEPVKRQEENCETTASPPSGSCSVDANGVGGNPKTGRITYNNRPYCLDVQKSGDTCTMLNTCVRVVDNENGGGQSKTTPITFSCSRGLDDEANEAYGVGNDAMYYGTVTGRLYIEKYDGFRALPWTPRLVIHYSTNYENAFWNGRDMFFGDGRRTFYPLVSQDVVAHELAHGLTDTNSDLVYAGQSGGINEAFSDMAGEAAEVFSTGDDNFHSGLEVERWGRLSFQVGYDIFKGSGALRYFIDPTDDGISIKHARDYRSGMDVHYSSGVFNHAFYRMIALGDMPMFEAFGCFVHANRFIWGPNTNFNEGGCGVVQGCYDLGYDWAAAKTAFTPVGIDFAGCNEAALTTTVSSGETRPDVRASLTRNPIFEVDAASGVIEATAEDYSTVTIEVATDALAANVIATGENTLEFQADQAPVYVKLSTASSAEVSLVLNVV